MRTNTILHATHIAAVARAAMVDLVVTNDCTDTIWPGIATTNGTGPEEAGFALERGKSRNLTVDTNWNGRVWGRTNCTFDDKGVGSCLSGDCGGILNCKGIGAAATLAEFNLPGGLGQSYYDISLVDGYNLPIAIQAILDSTTKNGPPANTTNPSCVGSVQQLSKTPFDPYANGQTFLDTSAANPLPFESALSQNDVATWCPSDLEVNKSHGKRAPFDPCVSPCERYKVGIYCCTGKYNGPGKCHANYYAKQAKKVCPDAYSYAYDDASSTFTAPTGSGFEVVFCPGGRSTMIKKTLSPSAGSMTSPSGSLIVLAVFVVLVLLSIG